MPATNIRAPGVTNHGSQGEPASELNRPLGAYTAISGVYAGAVGGFVAWLWRSGRKVPQRPNGPDLLLMSVATHKLSRLIAKDRVTSALRHPFTEYQGEAGPGEVDERARGTGLRRALGELLVCPYCLGLWVATAFSAGLIVAPRATRWAASTLSVLFASDVLQIAYRKLEDEL
jgi:Protein of unknown function (DUF1360)